MRAGVSRFTEALRVGREHGYQRGRLVDLRPVPEKTLYLVGDLHACWERIPYLIEHARLEPLLEEDGAVLVFLGDLFHPEDDEGAGRMDSSLRTLGCLMELKGRFPRNVYALLGNHEFTRTGSTKRGFFQGDLFREALEGAALWDTYREFIRLSPLAVVHPHCVGVHAGPARSLGSLEELERLEVEDSPPEELPQLVLELCFSRHRDWSPYPEKAYDDYQVKDFLQLCGCAGQRLITGHTPLDRETDWTWEIGAYTTVIFAAGREFGYYRVSRNRSREDREELVRVGRTDEGGTIVGDRAPRDLSPVGPRGHLFQPLTVPTTLEPDLTYRFEYPGEPMTLRLGEAIRLTLAHFRQLSPTLQSYCGVGYYLVGREERIEFLSLKTEEALLIGGDLARRGAPMSWGERELAVLKLSKNGFFEVRALVPGLSLSWGSSSQP